MKKTLLLASVLLAGCTLASCGNDADYNKIIIDSFLQGEAIKEDFTPRHINATAPKNVINNLDSDLGLLVVKDNNNRLGFYSLLHQDYILKTTKDIASYSYKIIRDGYNRGYLIEINDGSNYYAYDNLGNLIEASNKPLSIFSFSVSMENGDKHLHYKSTTLEVDKIYEDGKLLDSKQDNKSNPVVGEKFTPGKESLKKYGHDGYSAIEKNDIVTIIKDSNNEVKSTYYLKDDAKLFAGGYFIYQDLYQMPDDSKEFDYIENGQKYTVESKRQDMLTGKIKDIDLDYIIKDSIPLMEDKVFKYNLASIVEIKDNKLLDNPKDVLLSPSMKVLKDYTGYNLDLKRVGENVFSSSTNLLYNKNGKLIASLGSLRDVHTTKNLIVGSFNGKYGILNSDGILKEDFKFDSVEGVNNSNYLIVKENGKTYLYEDGNMTNISDKDYKILDGKILVIYDINGATVYALNSKAYYSIKDIANISTRSISLLNDQSISLITFTTDELKDYTYTIVMSKEFKLNTATI